MPKSEIDDIFAAKGKIPVPGPSSSKIPSTKKKSKKRPREHLETTDNNSSPPVVIPETIVDSSALVPPPAKRPKQGKKEKSSQPAAPDSFADSRGSGSRRQTEEGWSIYKEDELGMSNEGGDTALCPFDCECCF